MKDSKIYVDAYQLALNLFHRTKSFSKHLRPSLGRAIEEASLKLTFSTKKAMFSQSGRKTKHLYQTSEILDEIRILTQLSRDLEMISVGGYSEISKMTQELGRQIGGLIKHEQPKDSSRAPL